MRKITLILSTLFLISSAHAKHGINEYFRNIALRVDTSTFEYPKDTIYINNESGLPFIYNNDDEVCELNLFPNNNKQIQKIQIISSGDYELIDSIVFVNNEFYRFKIQFIDLTNSEFLKFVFLIKTAGDSLPTIRELILFPFTRTEVQFKPLSDELYIGEEKIFELLTNDVNNIRLQEIWTNNNKIDYKLTEKFSQIRLHLLPNEIGTQSIKLNLKTKKPFITKDGKVVYDLPQISYSFNVKKSRLQFLNIDENDLTMNDDARIRGIEVQMDNSALLQLNKTYRIENQEAAGGTLIGELFTRSYLANNKVLCQLRLYNYHRKTEGYLYLKDGDRAMFISNFSITPQTNINSISILHQGSDWSNRLAIYPGETILLKLEGDGLNKARFIFEGLNDISQDSLLRSENISLFKLKIPLDISNRRVAIINHGKRTGQELKVVEYIRPHSLDFVQLDFGDGPKKLTNINKPILYDKTIKDIYFSFDRDIIDLEKLCGPQYISISIRITNKNDNLIEMRNINSMVIYPGDRSPRAAYYEKNISGSTGFNLNNYINRKTYDLEEWSKIEIVINHQDGRYPDQETESRKIEIYLQKHYKFDMDVSFPAGLLVRKQGDTTFGAFGGISMAIIAQFSFYQPDKIARYRPYKIGMGFLAFNAFDFSDKSGNRDVGAVLIASLYPTTRDAKLSFPLYLGGGYFLGRGKWFYLIGPGIHVRL